MALRVVGVTALVDIALGAAYGWATHIGFWHGLYCATGTATTVGCYTTPRGWLAHTLSAAMMVTVVPLFSSVFALLTAGLTATHIDARHEELKQHVTDTAPSYEEGGGCSEGHR